MATFYFAQPTSDNTAGGALFSLWFLLGLFIIVAAVLWVIYARPHQRVPPRPAVRAHGATSVAGAGGLGGVGGESADTSPSAPQPVTPPDQGIDDTRDSQ